MIGDGLSEFHKLTVTQMKSTFHKQQRKILNFRKLLLYAMQQKGAQNIGCEQLEYLFMTILNKPLKKDSSGQIIPYYGEIEVKK